MKPLLALCLIAAGATVVGCRSANETPKPSAVADPPASESASAPLANPCSLVTVDEVSEVMGRRSRTGELQKAFSGNRCNFYDATSQYEIFLQTVDWNVAGGMMTPENTVQGIGEKAYWSFGSVYVLKNGRGMMIGFQLPDVLPKLTPQAEKLAKAAAGRM